MIHLGTFGKAMIVTAILVLMGTVLPMQSVSAQTATSPTLAPGAGATWTSEYNLNRETYALEVDWLHVAGTRGYIVALDKVRGKDPGDRIVTTKSSRYYPNITPGRWFLNVKARKANGWTEVLYWEIFLPRKTPEQVAQEQQERRQKIQEQSSAAESAEGGEGLQFVEPEPPDETSSHSPVDEFLADPERQAVLGDSDLSGGGQYQQGSAQTETTQPEDDRIAVLRMQIEQLLAKLLMQTGIDQDPGEILGEIGTDSDRTAPTPKQRFRPGTQQQSFSCDCSKRCRQMTSCAEAYFQLHQCGCVNLDPSNDGVPCGKLCPAN